MDDSSDSSPDVRVLTSGSVKGQVALGGSLKDDWALSAFDSKHAFSATFTWDLPIGKGRSFFKGPRPVRAGSAGRLVAVRRCSARRRQSISAVFDRPEFTRWLKL